MNGVYTQFAKIKEDHKAEFLDDFLGMKGFIAEVEQFEDDEPLIYLVVFEFDNGELHEIWVSERDLTFLEVVYEEAI